MTKLLALLAALAATSAAGDLKFRAAEGGEYEFDTGVLTGKLRAGGKSLGLSLVVHVPSGTALSRSSGLLGHYRVFSANHRYGPAAWGWASDASLRDDGSVEVHWPAAEDRPFEMWAVYRLAGPATIDLETRVRAQADLPAFESFLASYFTEPFTHSLVYAQREPGAGGKPALMAAEESFGVWQMFPRNRDALALIQDGRWKIPPNPVDWAIRPPLAQAVAVRRHGATGLTAVLMAPAEDCFAISTPHQREGHYSLYLSLFGRTVKAGQTARARARLVIADSPSDDQVIGLYRAYLNDLRGRR